MNVMSDILRPEYEQELVALKKKMLSAQMFAEAIRQVENELNKHPSATHIEVYCRDAEKIITAATSSQSLAEKLHAWQDGAENLMTGFESLSAEKNALRDENTALRERVKGMETAARKYMAAVAALGEQTGYNHMNYFEAPILKMPNEDMKAEAFKRWNALNDTGQELTKACDGVKNDR